MRPQSRRLAVPAELPHAAGPVTSHLAHVLRRQLAPTHGVELLQPACVGGSGGGGRQGYLSGAPAEQEQSRREQSKAANVILLSGKLERDAHVLPNSSNADSTCPRRPGAPASSDGRQPRQPPLPLGAPPEGASASRWPRSSRGGPARSGAYAPLTRGEHALPPSQRAACLVDAGAQRQGRDADDRQSGGLPPSKVPCTVIFAPANSTAEDDPTSTSTAGPCHAHAENHQGQQH